MSATASAPQAFGQPQQEGQQPPSPTRRSLVGNVKGIASTVHSMSLKSTQAAPSPVLTMPRRQALSIAQLALSDTTPAHAAHEVKRESEHGFELLVNLLKENTPARGAARLPSLLVRRVRGLATDAFCDSCRRRLAPRRRCTVDQGLRRPQAPPRAGPSRFRLVSSRLRRPT